MSLPIVLQEFATVCQSHFGSKVAGSSDQGVYVAIGSRVVMVNLDAKAGRAVFWTELARPAHAETAALQQAAMLHTSRQFLDDGFVVAVHAGANLIVLGRSIEQDVLQQYAALKLLSAVAEAGDHASAALASASASAMH